MTRVIDAVLDFFSNLFRSYKLECIEELVTAIAIMHNIIKVAHKGRRGVIPKTVPTASACVNSCS